MIHSRFMPDRHNQPIASHFYSGGLEPPYLGRDLDPSDRESEETIARITVWEGTAEHLYDVLSGDQGVDEAIDACTNWCVRCFGLWSQMPRLGASQLELTFEIGESDIDVARGHPRIDVAE